MSAMLTMSAMTTTPARPTRDLDFCRDAHQKRTTAAPLFQGLPSSVLREQGSPVFLWIAERQWYEIRGDSTRVLRPLFAKIVRGLCFERVGVQRSVCVYAC
jgi:hypothetical protein